MRSATCHPERKHAAKGLCATCYRKSWKPKKPSTCHPDRPVRGRGLCNPCYIKLRTSPAFRPEGRPRSEITCGHPDKKHAGRGLCEACSTAARRSVDPEADYRQRRDYFLRAKYGISLNEFSAMWAAQGESCALCLKPVPIARNRHVDHCHETGVVRGILCFTCNKGMGMLGDSPSSIRRALAYVIGELSVAGVDRKAA